MVKQEEDTEGYKVIGWIFLILSVILLLNATMLDPRKSQFGLVLFIFGNLSLVLGATITYLVSTKEEKRMKNKKSVSAILMIAIVLTLTQVSRSWCGGCTDIISANKHHFG